MKKNTGLLTLFCIIAISLLGCSPTPARMLDTSDALLYAFVELSKEDGDGFNQAVEHGGYDHWGANTLPMEQSVKYGIYKSIPFIVRAGQRIEVIARSKYPATAGTSAHVIAHSPVFLRVFPMEWRGGDFLRMDMSSIKDFDDTWEITFTQSYPQSETEKYVVVITNRCRSIFSLKSEVTMGGITMLGREDDHIWVEFAVKFVDQ